MWSRARVRVLSVCLFWVCVCVCVCIQRFKSFVALKALRNNPGQARYCQHQACEIWKQNQKIKNHRWQGLNWSKLRKERKVGFEWNSSSSSRDHKATPLPGASGAHAVKRAHAVNMQSPTDLQTCSTENLNLRDILDTIPFSDFFLSNYSCGHFTPWYIFITAMRETFPMISMK